MTQKEYELFLTNLKQYYGYDLFSYKQNQMQRRINSQVTKHGCKSYEELFQYIKGKRDRVEDFMDNITIHVSNFYRDKSKWDILQKEILPDIIKRNPGKLKIWSAACSSGEEPYTLSIILSHLLPSHRYEIFATDIESQILSKAKEGIYHERAMIEVPRRVKNDCFEYVDGKYHIKDIYKRNVRFQKHDLLKQLYGLNYDLIVCRNAMIYFTEQAKDDIYRKFNKSLTQDGILFIGSSEQIVSPHTYQFKIADKFFYKKI